MENDNLKTEISEEQTSSTENTTTLKRMTLKDLAAFCYSAWKDRENARDSEVLFTFDASSGFLRCIVKVSDEEAYDVFRNDGVEWDFPVIMRYLINGEDGNTVEKRVGFHFANEANKNNESEQSNN